MLIRCKHSEVNEGQLWRMLRAHRWQEPAVDQQHSDCVWGLSAYCAAASSAIFLWNLAPALKLLEKRVCQQRAAVMCLHRVLWGCRINPKETWCGHMLLSPGFHKMAITMFWKGTKGAGAEACLQKDVLLSDESEIWPGCPICISSGCLELKEKRGIQAQWFLESASS